MPRHAATVSLLRRALLAFALALGIFGLGTTATAGAAAGSAAQAPKAPLKVAVGFYAMTVEGLDQQDNSYYIDFYMWLRWRGDSDPSSTFEFMNNIERWGLTQTPVYEAPKTLPTGEKTQQFHVQGRYFAPLDLSKYPLDSHELPIQIEDTTADSKSQVYVLDTTQSGMDAGVRMPGWLITGSRLYPGDHRYETSFGERGSASATGFSRATFAIKIERPRNFFFWKLLLPLVIVMLVAISVLLVHPSLVEVRLAAPVTALLALVFLQQGYSDTLPENGNLVLLDKIYVISYALIVALIVTTILTAHWASARDDRDTRRMALIDRWVAGVLVAVFAVGSSVLVASA